jgi:predicted transcriptional regulator of viral defense system
MASDISHADHVSDGVLGALRQTIGVFSSEILAPGERGRQRNRRWPSVTMLLWLRMKRSEAVRSVGPVGALLLERMAERRVQTITVETDRKWLAEITPHYQRLLSRMSAARLLYRIRRGHYVVAPRGTFSAAQAASSELQAARVLTPGDYFISHLSALIAHRLTDVHCNETYASIRQSSGRRGKHHVELPSGTLRIATVTDARWPIAGSAELEEVRALPESIELIWRSGVERTLLDALARPDLCAGFEIVIGCWVSAKNGKTDWELLCNVAARQGSSMIRRTAYMLRLLGLGAIAERAFPNLRGRSTRVPLDRSDSYDMGVDRLARDRATGVVINVPPQHLQAWTGATSLT